MPRKSKGNRSADALSALASALTRYQPEARSGDATGLRPGILALYRIGGELHGLVRIKSVEPDLPNSTHRWPVEGAVIRGVVVERVSVIKGRGPRLPAEWLIPVTSGASYESLTPLTEA